MSEWENYQLRFPTRCSLNESEIEHLSILFTDYFGATDKGQRFLFAQLGNNVLWSTGPSHPWQHLDDNSQATDEVLTARFLNKEYIDNLHNLKGTGTYQGKDIKYSTT